MKEVRTEGELRDAIRHTGHFVIVQDIELTETLVINFPIIISCSPNSILKFRRYSDGNIPAIEVRCYGVQFTDLNLMGGGNGMTSADADGLQTGIKFSYKEGYGAVINSIITGFNFAGIHAFDVQELNVLNCSISGTDANYFNYGVWQGGRGNASGQVLNFVSNSVNNVRHAIGASGHPNSYFAVNNMIHSTIKHAFDRHSGDTPGVGGMHTHIIGNTFMNPDRYAFSVNEPITLGSVIFSGNKLKRAGNKPVGELCGNPVHPYYNYENIKLLANQYGI